MRGRIGEREGNRTRQERKPSQEREIERETENFWKYAFLMPLHSAILGFYTNLGG